MGGKRTGKEAYKQVEVTVRLLKLMPLGRALLITPMWARLLSLGIKFILRR
jgi:hypothetical protein